jgi:hypothetical protein
LVAENWEKSLKVVTIASTPEMNLITSLVPLLPLLAAFVSFQQLFDQPLRFPPSFVRLWDQLEVEIVDVLLGSMLLIL